MISLFFVAGLGWAAGPHTSLISTVTANGYGAIVWRDNRLQDAYPHLYQQLDAGADPTPDILYDTYFGITDLDGAGHWLMAPDSVEELDGTGIIEATQHMGDVDLVQYAFAPMTLGQSGLAMVAEVRNTTDHTIDAFQLVSLHNWLGGGYEEVAQFDNQTITEHGSDVAVRFVAPGADIGTCDRVYSTVTAGQRLAGDCGGSSSGVVEGFGWNIPRLAPGEERWVGVLATGETDRSWIAGRDARTWLLDEIGWWTEFHARGAVPVGLSADELAVYRQQLAFLKMAQVVEAGAPRGQVPASLPATGPVEAFAHIWNISWVRDGMYATQAFARAGYVTEAADVLRYFMQEGKSGLFAEMLGNAGYGVSLCRTYGDGSEWSDDDGTGPNIELDDLGMYLAALGTAIDAGGGLALATELGPRALDTVADPLVALIDPVSQLVVPDSSIWERHWNGNQKQFAWTSAQAVAGLRAAASIANTLGDPRATTYGNAANQISAGILENLVDVDGVVASSREELGNGIGYLDVAAAEVFNLGILDARGTAFAPTMTMWERWLRVPDADGFIRNDDAGEYDSQEWAFADLRMAQAYRRGCRASAAVALENRVTEMAMENHRVIPELYAADGADYAGPAPMLGFGAGLYVLGMHDRNELGVDCPPVEDTAAADSGTPGEPPDCGCSSGGGNLGLWALFLAYFASHRRVRARSAGSQ